jgi:hypothetical protein
VAVAFLRGPGSSFIKKSRKLIVKSLCAKGFGKVACMVKNF